MSDRAWAYVTHVLLFALTGCCEAAAFCAGLQQSQRLEQSDAALPDVQAGCASPSCAHHSPSLGPQSPEAVHAQP